MKNVIWTLTLQDCESPFADSQCCGSQMFLGWRLEARTTVGRSSDYSAVLVRILPTCLCSLEQVVFSDMGQPS